MSSYRLETEVRSPEFYLYLAVLGRFVTMLYFPQEALAKRHEGNRKFVTNYFMHLLLCCSIGLAFFHGLYTCGLKLFNPRVTP